MMATIRLARNAAGLAHDQLAEGIGPLGERCRDAAEQAGPLRVGPLAPGLLSRPRGLDRAVEIRLGGEAGQREDLP
jgi:hypothetical protein